MIPSAYWNFDLFFTRVGDEYRVDVIEAAGGEAKSTFELPFTLRDGIWLDTISAQSRHVKPMSAEAVTSTQTIRDTGRQLYETVFRGDVSDVLAHSLEAAEQTDVGLRIRLRFSEEVADLALLPWETLFDPLHDQFIGLSDRSPILRYLLLPRSKPTLLIKPPLRVLTLLSNPKDTPTLMIEREWEAMQTALADLQAAGKIVLERLEKPTFEALHTRLLGDDIHILHFVGHGTYDAAAQVGALLLEDEAGNSVLMQAQELGILLQNHRSLRLVYLNACEGALASNVNVFTGLAQTLVRYGVPAAVAMQAEITDQAAINLTRTFYTTLTQGYPVDAALTQARVTLASQNNQEWVTPVLFSRSPDNRLFDIRDVLPRPDCPYPGIVPFQEEQAEIFFGRNKEITDGVEHLRQYPFLTVVGPSGSGKSSLVYAGMIPALRKIGRFGTDGWTVKPMRPGTEPLTVLVEMLDTTSAALSAMSFQQRTLLFVDQFEELFTLAPAPDAQQFLDILHALVGMPNLYILLTVRADFYPELMASSLWERIKANRLEVAPLGEEELRTAILEPAAQVGVTVDETLVERLVTDAVGEAGVLPLVQETLVLLWDNVERRHLALEAYTALADGERSGLQVAIDRRADITYNNLSPEAQTVARRIFLRLIQFGEGRADTRRQLPERALRSAGDDPDLFDQTLQQLADSRLLTLSGGEEDKDRRVDISHEALITGWGRLREWVVQRREAEQIRRRLQTAAERFEELNYQGGFLDSVELGEAERWLHSAESAELGVSDSLQLLVRQSRKRQRRNTVILYTSGALVLLLIILIGSIYSIQQRQIIYEQDKAAATQTVYVGQLEDANTAQSAALATIEVQATAEARQSQISLSRQLAAQALNQLEDQPDLGMLLAVQANLITDTVSARSSLLTSIQHQPYLSKFLHGHNTDVNSVAFSPNGQILATGDDGGNIILWDIPNGQPQHILKHGQDNEVRSVAFSPNGQLLASVASVAGPEVTIILWDFSTATPKESEPIRAFGWGNLVFSPDSQTLAFGGSDGIQLFDVATRQQLQTFPTDNSTSSVAFSPNGQILAAGTGATFGGQDVGSVYLFDINSTQPLAGPLTGHQGYVQGLAFSPDNQVLASGGRDNKIILWDVNEGKPIGLPLSGHNGWVWSLAFSPDGQTLASGSFDKSVILWDVPNRQQRARLQGHRFFVNSVAFSPDGTTLASGGDGGIVALWDTTSSLPLGGQRLVGHTDTVNSVQFLNDQVLISGSHNGTTIKWDLSAQPIRGDTLNYEADQMRRISISPDGRILALGTSNGIILWDLINEQMLSAPLATDLAWELAFSSDSRTLAASSKDNAITLWNMTTYKQQGQLLLADGVQVESLAFNPIEQTLVSGDDHGMITLWNVSTQQPLDTLSIGRDSTVYSLAFSPDGQTLAAGDGEGNIEIWQASPWYLLHELSEGHNFLVVGLAFSPDGQVLASIDEVEGNIVLWDVNTGQQLGKPLIGHQDGGWDLAFSPNGQTLASSSYDKSIILWQISPSLWQVEACRKANRNLSWSEWNRFVGSETPFERTCPNLPIPSSVIEAARDLARVGQIDEAIAQFEYLLTLDPNLNLDPQSEVERAIE